MSDIPVAGTADRADFVRLSRIEDAGLNASAPREQLWIDGLRHTALALIGEAQQILKQLGRAVVRVVGA